MKRYITTKPIYTSYIQNLQTTHIIPLSSVFLWVSRNNLLNNNFSFTTFMKLYMLLHYFIWKKYCILWIWMKNTRNKQKIAKKKINQWNVKWCVVVGLYFRSSVSNGYGWLELQQFDFDIFETEYDRVEYSEFVSLSYRRNNLYLIAH